MKSRSIVLRALLMAAGIQFATAQTPAVQPAAGQAVIPAPVSRLIGSGTFTISATTQIIARGTALEAADYLNTFLSSPLITVPWQRGMNYIGMAIDPDAGLRKDGYRLSITPFGIEITGADYGGLFYGVQTLLQLLPPEIYGRKGWVQATVACQSIEDYPRFDYRGAMLDVARTFSDIPTVKRFIDNMAHHKLNKLHLHLADDEGWRVEIKAYPQLTQVGAWRGPGLALPAQRGAFDEKYGGYYTQEEIRDLVAYARTRNIEIIPEIDLPGHSRAFVHVFPESLCGVAPGTEIAAADRRNVLCVAKEGNYEMLDTIIGELAALFPSPIFHIGSDEVGTAQWSNCLDCRALMRGLGTTDLRRLEEHFVERVNQIVKKHGKISGVWNEAAANGRLDKSAVVYGWQDPGVSVAATERGYKTVVMPGSHFYIDMKQSPYEEGMTWAGIADTERLYSFDFGKYGFSDAAMSNVLGVEGAFWSEILLANGPSFLDYQTYPRLCAVAEIGWSQPESHNWERFYDGLTACHLARLRALGINYRAFPPRVDYAAGVITATAPFEAAEIYYTTDGSTPTSASARYTSPVTGSEPDKYRFSAFEAGTRSYAVTPAAKFGAAIGASSSQTFTVPLAGLIDRTGAWHLRFCSPDGGMRVESASIDWPGGSRTISGGMRYDPLYPLKVNLDQRSLAGNLVVTVRNDNPFPCELSFEFERLSYIEPAVKVSSSMPVSGNSGFANIESYNYSSTVTTTRTARAGDYLLFTFASPFEASSITVATGYTYMAGRVVSSGHIEVSENGILFTDAGTLEMGRAVIAPTGMVKAIRIVADGEGVDPAVIFQPLRILP